jgi:hypothetical protein
MLVHHMRNTIKKLILCIASAVFILCGTVAVFAASSYVGNKSTKVYHMAECTYTGKISTKNRVYFSSRSAAEDRGYRRCHYCGDGVVNSGNGGNHSNDNSNSTASDFLKQKAAEEEKKRQQWGKEKNESTNNTLNNSETTDNGIDNNRTVNEEQSIWQQILVGVQIFLAVICIFFGPYLVVTVPIHVFAFIYDWRKKKQQSDTPNETNNIAQDDDYKKENQKSTQSYKYINSSIISEAEFENDVIYITFKSGGVYAYYNVPQKVYDDLIAAQSAGRYFHDHIEGKYPFAPYHK